jgi:hypothetical protein
LFLLISISTDSPNWIFLTSVIDLMPKLGVSAKLFGPSKCVGNGSAHVYCRLLARLAMRCIQSITNYKS